MSITLAIQPDNLIRHFIKTKQKDLLNTNTTLTNIFLNLLALAGQ